VESIHAAQQGISNKWVSEYRFLHANGAVLYVVDRGFVLRNEKGKAIRMLGSMMDITEQRELTERLAQAQKMQAVGHLTGGVAHDFNNLLTVILGNTELIHELVEDDEELSELAAMTVSAAKRGAELTQRLLAFARRQALEPKLLNLNRVIGAMEGLLRRTLAESIDLRLVLKDDLWNCEADPHQLESALLNLVINARDAMPRGGRLTVETDNVSLEEKSQAAVFEMPLGRYAVLSVSDTGQGMSAEALNQAFEPFFTTKLPDKGSGLGLSMVYGFLKQSGGQAKIYSKAGEGTTVKLYFPQAHTQETPQTLEPPPIAAYKGTETILVVEDDELVRKHVVGLLTGLGYSVIVTANGHDALVQLEQNPQISLLFTDIIMPGGMNGRQLADTALARHPNLRVLYTSGYAKNVIVHHGRLDPGIALLGKPYTRQELARKVRLVLDETGS
jgi:signal transduction histidine kinase